MSLSLHVEGPGVAPTDISYDEVERSPTEQIAETQYRASRIFIVPWEKRWTFCAGMIGWPALKKIINPYQRYRGVDRTYIIQRAIPQGYAALDLDPSGITLLYGAEIDGIKGEGRILSYDRNNVAQYKKARISIGFKTLSYKVISDVEAMKSGPSTAFSTPDNGVTVVKEGADESSLFRYVTIFHNSQATYTTLPFGTLRWVQQNPEVRVNNVVGRVIDSRELVLVWHQVPTLPIALKSLIGTVNAYFFQSVSGNVGANPGTLLLTSVSVLPYRWFFNQRVYDITYRFKEFDAPIIPGTPTKDADDQPILSRSTGHNVFPHYNSKNNAIFFQQVTNNGIQVPNPDTILTPGVVSITFPPSGWTPYQHANFQSLLFPSAPPPTPE